MSAFHPIERLGQTIWMHESNRVWIVKYEATDDRIAFYQGYRAVAQVKPGHAPWAVDNRRIGTEKGFISLYAAVDAAEAAMAAV